MKISFISTQTVNQGVRSTLARMQTDLVKAQKELSTGRVADQGLALGAQAGRSVSLARDIERLGVMIDTNALAAGRLSTTQDALGQIGNLAQSFLGTLTSTGAGSATEEVARQDAANSLAALTAVINSNLNGEYIFAGINTDVQPLNDFFAPGSLAKASLDAAFLGHFGFTQTDPAAATITAADMQAFLDTVAEPLFLGGGWAGNWSNASDQAIVTRIALHETAETSVSANNDGTRKLVMATALVADLLRGPLSTAGREVLFDKAVQLAGAATADIADLQATTGLIEQRITRANERLSMQIEIFERGVHDLEAVDPYELSIRISTLLGQIETSYALTARIHQLSLVRYLP
jgi:flagellar hook-associated protein 3 FlgL